MKNQGIKILKQGNKKSINPPIINAELLRSSDRT